MKQYLIDTFMFNDWANKAILEKIKDLPEAEESVKLFSHLIHSQNKWMARMTKDSSEAELEWFDKPFGIDELENKWNDSLGRWLKYLDNLPEAELNTEVLYQVPAGNKLGAMQKDIALQLNYHSIHHRAQICLLLRKQNIEPPFIEYIGRTVKRY